VILAALISLVKPTDGAEGKRVNLLPPSAFKYSPLEDWDTDGIFRRLMSQAAKLLSRVEIEIAGYRFLSAGDRDRFTELIDQKLGAEISLPKGMSVEGLVRLTHDEWSRGAYYQRFEPKKQ
jgi:hypothetical protein